MSNLVITVSRSAFVALLTLGLISAAAFAQDLSRYRNFKLGADLTTVIKEAGVDLSQVKLIHTHPALIQELQWRPQALGSIADTESSKDVTLSFYNGELFRISVNYDRYSTEGMTASDLVDAISATYGVATKPNQPAKSSAERYGDPEELLAQWEDSQYCYTLIRRSTYGPSFTLVGVLKKLAAPAQAAVVAATRIEAQEAPQREIERLAEEKQAEQAKLDKARLLNKPRFRP